MRSILRLSFSLGHSGIKALRASVNTTCGALRDCERDAIDRLESFAATLDDLETLATRADYAGLNWSALFPEWRASRDEQ